MRELNCSLCSIRSFMCYHYLNLKEQMQILCTLSFVECKGSNSYLLINSFLKYVCNARPFLLPNVGHYPICKELLNFIIKVILSFPFQSSNWATTSSGSPTRESDHTSTELATTSTRQSEWNNHTLQCSTSLKWRLGGCCSFSAVNTSLRVSPLHPFYTYTCIVAAVTVGLGPYSAPVVVRTPEDGNQI